MEVEVNKVMTIIACLFFHGWLVDRTLLEGSSYKIGCPQDFLHELSNSTRCVSHYLEPWCENPILLLVDRLMILDETDD